MSSIVIQGDTSGSITVEAPSVAGTHTLTLPKATGNIATDATVGLGTKNLIINGDMRIAQRGTSVSGLTTGGYYTVDRWKFNITTAGTWTMEQDTDVPTGQGFANSMKMSCTTADASLAAGDRVWFDQRVEGYNLQQLAYGTASAKSITVSFWVKSNKTGTYILEFYSDDSNKTASKSYTISSANTWEKKTIILASDTVSGFNNDNGLSLYVWFWLAAGSTYSSGTLNTSWAANVTANRAVGQTNLADSTSNYINITGVQLELGENATPFENRMYSQELAMCQRYYWKIAEGSGQMLGLASYYTSGGVLLYVQSPSPMRNTPTVDQVNGTDYYGFERNGAVDGLGGSFALYRFNGVGCQLYTTSGASGTAGQSGVLWTNNAASYIALTAEL